MLSRIFNQNKPRQVVYIFLFLAIIYASLVLFLPQDQTSLNKYRLTSTEQRALGLTVVVPYVAIWLTAAYGYIKFKSYAQGIRKSRDGAALNKIADGLLVLALWMPISAISSSLLRYFGRTNMDFLPSSVIIKNYIDLAIVLTAFYIIYQGAAKLPGVLKKYKDSSSSSSIILPTLFVLISTVFVWSTFANPARGQATDAVPTATYYLPDWLLLVTVVVPYIFVWAFGIRAVMYIREYSQQIPGKIYRSALSKLSAGIFFAVLSLITLRLLSASTAWFNAQELKVILAAVYLLLILIAVGYVLIAMGAKRLQRIEEV